MDWIINGLAFVGALALAAIAIFLWACWHDVTSQPTRPRQTKPRSASGRHSSRSTSGASSGRYPHSGGAGTTAAPHSTGRTGWLASRRTARAIRRQQRQAWDRAMRAKQAQDLAAFYAALAMAEEVGRAHGRDGREAPRS